MNRNQELDAILADLRREHRETDLPPSLEASLLAATRPVAGQHRRASRVPVWAWATLSAASLLVCALWILSGPTHSGPTQSNGKPAMAGVAPAPVNPVAPAPNALAPAGPNRPTLEATHSSAVHASSNHNPQLAAASTSTSRESLSPHLRRSRSPLSNRATPIGAGQDSGEQDSGDRAEIRETGFLTIPGAEGLPMPGDASIVRIALHKADLQQFGFQVPPASFADLIHADFLLGEDGLPRAIRLVNAIAR